MFWTFKYLFSLCLSDNVIGYNPSDKSDTESDGFTLSYKYTNTNKYTNTYKFTTTFHLPNGVWKPFHRHRKFELLKNKYFFIITRTFRSNNFLH